MVNGDVLQNRISAWLTGYGDPEFARSAQCARGCPGAAGDLPIERRQAFGHFHCLGSSQRSAHAEMSAVPEREVRAARPRRIEQSRAMATASFGVEPVGQHRQKVVGRLLAALPTTGARLTRDVFGSEGLAPDDEELVEAWTEMMLGALRSRRVRASRRQ